MNTIRILSNLSLLFLLTIIFSCTEKDVPDVPGGDVSTKSDSIYLGTDPSGAFDYIALATNGYFAAVQKTDSVFDIVCVFDSIVPNENSAIIAYCDSTGRVLRLKTKENCYDVKYHQDDNMMDVMCLSGDEVKWVRNIKSPYSSSRSQAGTRAGNVLDLWDISSVLSDVALGAIGALTGTGAISKISSAGTGGLGSMNTILGGNAWLTAGAGIVAVGASLLTGTGEVLLGIAALKAILDTGNASINDLQNRVAKEIYNNAQPVTGDHVAVGKQRVRLTCTVDGVSSNPKYQMFNVGIIVADLILVNKSHHLMKQSKKYNGQTEYSFVFDVDPHKRYKYRAILEPSFPLTNFEDTYLDYWLYGPVREFTLEDPEIVITEAKQISVENNAGHNFIFTVSVKAECEAEVDRWGVALYRDLGGDELEAVRLAEEGAKNGSFQFTIDVNSVMMDTDAQPYRPLAIYKVAPYIRLGSESYYYTDDYTILDLQYGSQCPDDHHPHAIDLGLPSGTKWCCCNVGASTPEGYGGYYAWGETSEKSVYNSDTYAYFNRGYVYIGSDIAGTGYDAATVNMGAPWRMPSTAQQQELINHCSRQWTKQNGVYGILVTGPNGGQIFLPAAGGRWDGGLYSAGSGSRCWSSSLYPDDDGDACSMGFDFGDWGWGYNGRYFGQSVRAVCP